MEIRLSNRTNESWGNVKKFTDSYKSIVVQAQAVGRNLHYKLSDNGKISYLTIVGFNRYTALQILDILSEYEMNNRHSYDATLYIYKKYGLKLGFDKED